MQEGEMSAREGEGGKSIFIIKYFDWFKKTINAREAQIKRTLKS